MKKLMNTTFLTQPLLRWFSYLLFGVLILGWWLPTPSLSQDISHCDANTICNTVSVFPPNTLPDVRTQVFLSSGAAGLALGFILLAIGYRRSKPRLKFSGFILSIAAAVIYLNGLPFGAFEAPIAQQLSLSYPTLAVQDAQRAHYVTDNAQRRIVKVASNGQLLYRINGGQRSVGHFFYANDIAADDSGRLFVLNVVTDRRGFYLDREEILRFTPDGHYDGIVYQRTFKPDEKKPELGLRGEIMALKVKAGVLSWFQVTATGILTYEHRINTGLTQQSHYYPFPNANLWIGDITQSEANTITYSDKRGQVQRLDVTGQTTVLFATHDKTDQQPRIVPWELDIDQQGRIYFVDLEGRSVRRIDTKDAAPVVLDQAIIAAGRAEETSVFNYYRLSIAPDNTLITCNDEAIISRSSAGVVHYVTEASFGLIEQGLHWTAWFASSWLFVLVFWGGILAYIEIIGKDVPPLLVRASGIIVVVVVTAILSAQPLIDRFSTQHRNLVIEKIKEIITLVPEVIDVKQFDRIKTLADFGNAEYVSLRKNITSIFTNNYENWSEGYYFALYRVIDNRLYGFMYMNGQIGMYHPFDWLGSDGVFDRALAGQIAAESSVDVAGSWIYGVGAIKNEQGQVVALLEAGTDLYIFQLENEALIREIIVNLATALIVLILVLVEFAYAVEILKQRAMHFHDDQIKTSDVLLARPLAFLFFISVAISLSFIPLMMKTLYQPVAGLPMEVVLALPLSLELFGLGLASILGGFLVNNVGWKGLFYIGADVAATGLLLSGGADNMLLLGIGRFLTGSGSGLVFLALRSLVNMEQDIIIRNQGFSHLYSGMTAGTAVGAIFGGALAELLGYSPVFLISLLFIVLVILLQMVILKKPSFMSTEKEASTFEKGVSSWKAVRILVTDPQSVSLFMLIVFPAYIAAAFTFYYFPLYAETQGLSTGTIGLFIIFGSLCVIYLGPVLTDYISRTIGPYRGMLIGTMFCGGGLVLFGLFDGLPWAVLAIATMGIAEGFSVPAQNEVFLQSRFGIELGEDRTAGYYELLGNLGEMIGPIAFAVAMTLAAISGPLLIGSMVMIFGVLFFMLMQSRLTVSKKNNSG